MYQFFFRVVFTRLDPERVHHLAVLLIRACGWPGVRAVLGRITRPAPVHRVTTLGHTFSSPFGLAAGFDKDVQAVRGLGALGFGHVEVGTITPRPQPGNPRPRLFRLPLDRALVNRMGFNNRGVAVAAARLARLRRPSVRDLPVIGVNIGKNRDTPLEAAVDDYVACAVRLAPLADYLAVNVSSPNTPGLRGLQAESVLTPLLRAVQDAAGSTPVLVKIAPDLGDDEIRVVCEVVAALGLAGVIATNTTITRSGLRTPQSRLDAVGAGGLSGPPLAARAIAVLHLVRAALPPSSCVIAVGGVTSAADVRARLDAGATLVQGYSGFIYEGPAWPTHLHHALRP